MLTDWRGREKEYCTRSGSQKTRVVCHPTTLFDRDWADTACRIENAQVVWGQPAAGGEECKKQDCALDGIRPASWGGDCQVQKDLFTDENLSNLARAMARAVGERGQGVRCPSGRDSLCGTATWYE